jgi:hypothetical protein
MILVGRCFTSRGPTAMSFVWGDIKFNGKIACDQGGARLLWEAPT